jgi:hypothetical protein
LERLNKLEIAYCTQNLSRSLNLYIMKLRDLIENREDNRRLSLIGLTQEQVNGLEINQNIFT